MTTLNKNKSKIKKLSIKSTKRNQQRKASTMKLNNFCQPEIISE